MNHTTIRCPNNKVSNSADNCGFEKRRQVEMKLERVKGIEPSSQAWEARILPLNLTRFRHPNPIAMIGVCKVSFFASLGRTPGRSGGSTFQFADSTD